MEVVQAVISVVVLLVQGAQAQQGPWVDDVDTGSVAGNRGSSLGDDPFAKRFNNFYDVGWQNTLAMRACLIL